MSSSAHAFDGALGSLPSVLRLDAVTGVVTSVALVAASAALSPVLGVPTRLLLAAGLLALPFAVVMWIAAREPLRHRALVWSVIVGNVAWVVLSLLVALVWFAPTTLGRGVIVGQAVAVAVLAWLEHRAFARLRTHGQHG